jgi:hypothetical protein
MEREHFGRLDSESHQLMPSEGKTPLPPEYAKYKNRPSQFALAIRSNAEALNRYRKLAMTDNPAPPATEASVPERKPLTPAARRALAEAEARRQAAEANAKPAAKELQGPKGPEPTRYGDWENKGIASDF